mgnify:CR=1 FL=1
MIIVISNDGLKQIQITFSVDLSEYRFAGRLSVLRLESISGRGRYANLGASFHLQLGFLYAVVSICRCIGDQSMEGGGPGNKTFSGEDMVFILDSSSGIGAHG